MPFNMANTDQTMVRMECPSSRTNIIGKVLSGSPMLDVQGAERQDFNESFHENPCTSERPCDSIKERAEDIRKNPGVAVTGVGSKHQTLGGCWYQTMLLFTKRRQERMP
ncbi:uncharacterized protein LOC119167672 [Rhipicephalus microplus]|uniref:uncharacterized protein LOC119167672 n=1 Tax=Rhipicephalus microplus TaxID=6941 RepID=UPI003F6C685A